MCLMRIDPKPMRKYGIGYKTVSKKKGGYLCFDFSPKAGTASYPLNQWVTDENTGMIGVPAFIRYPAGFHVILDRAVVLRCAKLFSEHRDKRIVAIKVRFRKVVATNLRGDDTYGREVVAREIMNLGEVKS